MKSESQSPHIHNRKKAKVKKVVGGRDVKAEVMKDRDNGENRGMLGQGKCESILAIRSDVRVPQFTRPSPPGPCRADKV
jgi:hypothetical protein